MTRDEVFASWLADCRARGGLSGQDLYRRLLDYGQGRFFVDSSDADAMLRDAQRAGLIVHGEKTEPTFTQRSAGIGGGRWDLKNPFTNEHYLHLYFWTVVERQTLPEGWDAT